MSDTEKYKLYAEKIKIFNGFEPEEVEAILKKGRIERCREEKVIFRKGQEASGLHIVLSGVVGIHQGDNIIARCESGDVFGEMSALIHEPHSVTATALTTVKLFTLQEEQLNEILKTPVAVRLLLNIIQLLSEHLSGANRWVEALRK